MFQREHKIIHAPMGDCTSITITINTDMVLENNHHHHPALVSGVDKHSFGSGGRRLVDKKSLCEGE